MIFRLSYRPVRGWGALLRAGRFVWGLELEFSVAVGTGFRLWGSPTNTQLRNRCWLLRKPLPNGVEDRGEHFGGMIGIIMKVSGTETTVIIPNGSSPTMPVV